jgi:hypothetical protein
MLTIFGVYKSPNLRSVLTHDMQISKGFVVELMSNTIEALSAQRMDFLELDCKLRLLEHLQFFVCGSPDNVLPYY